MLTKLLLNPSNTVYLRGLEKEFGVSSNTVRHELNKLSDINLIELADSEEGNQKQYKANINHPMFSSLRGFILKHVGLDALIEKVFSKLGQIEEVYLTNDWAEGKESPFIDLVVVGMVDRNYMQNLIDKVEQIIKKKIRVAVYADGFETGFLQDLKFVQII